MTTKTPWLEGELTLTQGVVAALSQHAEATYPAECCGLLVGPLRPAELLTRCIPQPNLARDPRTAFEISPLLAARQLDDPHAPLKAIYHSHCDADASWSATDAHSFCPDGRLLWPCAFLIVSVHRSTVTEIRLWQHLAGKFEEATLHIR